MDVLHTTLPWLLLLAAFLAFADTIMGIGVLFPGEVAITALAANLAGTQRLLAILVVSLGATAGDHTGYLLGRHFGGRLASSRLVRRLGTQRWTAATRLVDRHGAAAVFGSRLLPLVRTVMPGVAGVAGLQYAKFAAASIAGSILWATLWVSAGGALAALGVVRSPTLLVTLAGLAAALTSTAAVRRHRATKRRGSPTRP
ncbi:MAG: DedA family protein [Pedococcus sp.]